MRQMGRLTTWVVAGCILAAATRSATGAGPCYVMRDGRAVGMVKSETELAVRFDKAADAKDTVRRMAASGSGQVQDWPGLPDWPVKMLKVDQASPQRRARVRQDAGVAWVRPVYRFAGHDVPVVSSGTVVLRLDESLTEPQREQLLADYRLAVVEPVEGLKDVYVVEPIDGEDEDEVLRAEALASDWRVRWAQPNLIRPLVPTQVAVQDPYYDQQWHLNNTGFQGGTPDADIDAPEAWTIAEGIDVIMGIFDDAIDVTHPDLRDGYMGTGQDPSEDPSSSGYSDPRPKDIGDKHGTAVLGLACARGNTIGVRGVAYLSQFTASRGLREALTDAKVASVYTFARQQNVAVHINSWGTPGTPNSAIVEEALVTAFREGRTLNDAPYGMIVVFSSGNDGEAIDSGWEYATLPQVFGVGASNVIDRLASYSNWGPNVNILAPSGDDFLAALSTTDVSDAAGYPDYGYNRGGVSNDQERRGELDSAGNYTKWFSGTSAACPVAAGAAALVVSRNPFLTATDVKAILEHTAEKIAPGDARYGQVTARSEKYGYGRINAHRAVEAAEASTTNGGYTWPLPVTNVSTESGVLFWSASSLESGRGETSEYLVVQSTAEFTFWAEDGACYDCDQAGCSPGGVCNEANITPLPAGVEIIHVGSAPYTLFAEGVGRTYFGIYARSAIGRYSFGFAVDSDGGYWDEGSIDVPVEEPGEGGQTGGSTGPARPAVTIYATPLSGRSPLTVTFRGNAVSSANIDESRTTWDFDISDGTTVNATTRNAQYTYEVGEGEQRTFVARLTMYDVNGNSGSASVAIKVDGGGAASGPSGENELRIVVGVPGTVGSDVDSGTSPFSVELSLDATKLAGSLQSVEWDLGDGTTARSLSVPHTYINTSGSALVFPVTAKVTTATSATTTVTTVVSRLVTVYSSSGSGTGNGNDNLPGTGTTGGSGATTCGLLGAVPLTAMVLLLPWIRRRV